MNSKFASWATVAFALGALPVSLNAQTHAAPKTSEVSPAVRPVSPAGEVSETQWLRDRVVQLEAALIAQENCSATLGSGKQAGAAMKPAAKAGKKPMAPMTPAAPMAPAPMAPMMDDDKMMMGGGMKDKKMDPGPMQPAATATPAPMPMPMEDM